MYNKICIWLLIVCTTQVIACSHQSHVALLSNGELAGRRLSTINPGPVLAGEDCGAVHYLSKAFNNALNGTPYDTIVDATVTTETGVLVFNNCVAVSGRGVRSADLPAASVSTDRAPGRTQ